MGLRLRKGRPPMQTVPLGGGSSIRVRPAEQFNCDEALARVTRDLAAIQSGSEAAERLVPLLGEEFDVEALKDHDRPRLAAAAQKLADIYLVMACQDGWDDVALDDGTELEAPEPWSVALLLRDPIRRAAIMAVVNSAIHLEQAEGNGLPASLNGGAGIPDGAPTAGPAATPAPTAGA